MSSLKPVRFLDRTTPPHIFTIILLAGLPAIAMNMFLPSLPSIADHFDAEYQLMQLSITGLLGLNAILQIIAGPISDKFGRRYVILTSLSIFILASIGTLIAQTAEVFLMFRFLQAVSAIPMTVSRAIIRDMYEGAKAASMLGYVVMGMSVIPMLAPALGGLMEETFGWQSTFVFLAVVGAGILALCWTDQGETAKGSGLTLGAQFAQYPELFLSRRFWGYTLSSAFSSGAFFTYLGGGPYVGSVIYGLDASELGLLFGCPAFGYFFGNFASGRYSERVGINNMIVIGATIASAGLGISLSISLANAHTPLLFFAFMVFVGLGNGMVIPNATAGALSVRPHLAGTASGLSGAIMIGGGALLSAIAGYALTPETGETVLISIMFSSTALSVICIYLVIRRERALD